MPTPPDDRYGNYYQVLAETAEDHIFVIDRDDRIEYVNLAGARQHGTVPERLIGRRRTEIFPPSIAERQQVNLQRVFDTGRPLYVEAPTVYNGRELWLGTSLAPIYDGSAGVRAVLGVARNMTARKQAEDALRKVEADLSRAQKLEALARLAGGIAHDFNNDLTTILGYVDMLIEQAGGDSAMTRDLEDVRRSAEHAAGLVRRLLTFSRQQAFEPRTVNLNAVVSALESTLRRLLGERIRLELDTAPDLHAVTSDPREIEQLIVDLALNGRDAMPDGGTFTIQTRNATPSQEHRPTMGDGRYVSVRIRDTGAGMTPYVKQHVFEPFFTTKSVGEGTGLGLSAVYGIVSQLNGFIWVESEVGQGSTFHVYLPAVVERPAQDTLPHETGTMEPQSAGPAILLVEDEDAVRRFTKRALELHGYRVLEAATPEEALSLANGGEALSLLLTDVVMPRISGPELAERLKRVQPDLAVLYMSGYPSPLLLPDGSIDAAMPFLPKPFTAGQLIRTIQKRLSPET